MAGSERAGGPAFWRVATGRDCYFAKRAVFDAVYGHGGPGEYQHSDDGWADAAGSVAECFAICSAADDDAVAESGGVPYTRLWRSGTARRRRRDWAVWECAGGRRGRAGNGELLAFADEEFGVHGKSKLQIGVEAANVLNHRNYEPPNMQVDSSGFGSITGAADRGRGGAAESGVVGADYVLSGAASGRRR